MTSADVILFELINGSWTSPFLDHLMPAISSLDVWTPFILAGTLWIRNASSVGRRRSVFSSGSS